jgi:hypothetical protein
MSLAGLACVRTRLQGLRLSVARHVRGVVELLRVYRQFFAQGNLEVALWLPARSNDSAK